MSSKAGKGQDLIPYQALLNENDALKDENHALQDEVRILRTRLAEAEKLTRAISEGGLDALVLPGPEGKMVFTLDSADQANRTLAETANEDIVIVDDEFKITYVGKRLIKKTGYSQEEVIGRSWLDFVDEESKAYSELRMEKRRQGIDESYELKLICKNSSPYWVLISAKPLFDENGKFKGALAMLTDITERKRAEEASRESEARLQVVIAHSPDIIFEQDRDLRYVWIFNPASPYAVSDVLGKTDADLLPPDQAQKLAAIKHQVLDTGIHEHTLLQLSPGGELRWYEAIYEPRYDAAGQVSGVISYTRDVTDRIQMEEALRKNEELARQRLQEIEDIYEWAPIGLCVFDEHLRWQRLNRRIAEINGVPIEAHFGKMPSEVVPDVGDQAEEALRQILQTGERLDFEMSGTTLAKPGVLRFWDEHWVPMKDKNGRIIGISVVAEEITERKEIEAKLKETLENLDKLVKERTAELEKAYEFLKEIETVRKQEIHHRIKNNLQVISSLLDLQAEKFTGKKKIEDSEVLEAFKESQDRVISMALIHEELHKGGEIDALNFSTYIKELADNLFLTYRCGNDGTSLDIDIQEDIYLDMDTSVPLGIIINELISNCLKYASSGRDKGEIRIKLHREENGECEVEGNKSTTFILSVSDNGVGIPEDIEVENLNSLGLQLVTSLVDQLDGELELKRNNGTEFIIKFTVIEKYIQVPEPATQQSIE